MDGHRFDNLLRALFASPSRRDALRLLVGSASAGLLPIGALSADAKGGKKWKSKKGCPKGKKKCGKKCISKGSCCTYVDCTGCSAENCINGKCQCDPEMIMHNGKCGYFINCLGYGEPCGNSTLECCGNCVFDVDAGEARCGKSIHDCISDNDCKSGPCNGFLCPEANKPYFDLCRGLPGGPNDA